MISLNELPKYVLIIMSLFPLSVTVLPLSVPITYMNDPIDDVIIMINFMTSPFQI